MVPKMVFLTMRYWNTCQWHKHHKLGEYEKRWLDDDGDINACFGKIRTEIFPSPFYQHQDPWNRQFQRMVPRSLLQKAERWPACWKTKKIFLKWTLTRCQKPDGIVFSVSGLVASDRKSEITQKAARDERDSMRSLSLRSQFPSAYSSDFRSGRFDASIWIERSQPGQLSFKAIGTYEGYKPWSKTSRHPSIRKFRIFFWDSTITIRFKYIYI